MGLNTKQKILKNRIFKEVRKIPKGETRSYKDIAKAVKTNPRVVGRILAQNLKPIKIPCHRVIMASGKVGGYTFKGKRKDEIKIQLLRKEGMKINGKIVS